MPKGFNFSTYSPTVIFLFVYNGHLNGCEVTSVLRSDSNTNCVSPINTHAGLPHDYGYLGEYVIHTRSLGNTYCIVRNTLSFKEKA